MRHKIFLATGFAWRNKERRWLFYGNERHPASYELAEAHQRMLLKQMADPQFAAVELQLLTLKLEQLWESLSSPQRFKLLFRLHDHLEAARNEFEIDHLKELFLDAAGTIQVLPGPPDEPPFIIHIPQERLTRCLEPQAVRKLVLNREAYFETVKSARQTQQREQKKSRSQAD